MELSKPGFQIPNPSLVKCSRLRDFPRKFSQFPGHHVKTILPCKTPFNNYSPPLQNKDSTQNRALLRSTYTRSVYVLVTVNFELNFTHTHRFILDCKDLVQLLVVYCGRYVLPFRKDENRIFSNHFYFSQHMIKPYKRLKIQIQCSRIYFQHIIRP